MTPRLTVRVVTVKQHPEDPGRWLHGMECGHEKIVARRISLGAVVTCAMHPTRNGPDRRPRRTA